MKEQINRYARGAFEYEPLSVLVEPSAIDDVVWKNQVYTGRLVIQERDGRDIKGLVYSTNNRVMPASSQFVGDNSVIDYTIDTAGIEAGDRITGFFRLVTSGGEEDIPYEFAVEAGAYDSELGNVKNLFHLANLAQTNPGEAVRIFTRPEFTSVFLKDDLVLGKLHDQLISGSDIKTAMEEFFVAVHKKTTVHINLDCSEFELTGLTEDVARTVTVSKDAWGRIEIKVRVCGDFIDADRDCLTEEDFTGGKLEYTFYIRRDKLHGGKNTGKIIFSTPFEQKELVIRVDNSSGEDGRLSCLMQKKSLVSLMRTYIDFRLHRINTAGWISGSKNVAAGLLESDEDNPVCCLLMSQILITEKKMNEAKYYLDCAKDTAVEEKDTRPELYCYYLYVNTLYNRDRTYALETAQTVKEIYEKQAKDWRILWILLYLDIEMSKNKSLKLLRIKEQYKEGMRSPVLYLEACIILNEQPLLLRVLNDFEIQVLLYGCKEGMIEEKLLKHAAELAVLTEGRAGLLYRLLTRLYEESPDKEVLEAICSMLIRNGMTGPKYLKWYGYGIEKGLKVTKLFEYYLASRDRADKSPLPKMVLLYFGYNNELDMELRAYLYANLIRYREDNPQIYRNYALQMEEFVSEVLLTGWADENTGTVLLEYLTKDMFGMDNARTAAKVLFTYKVSCHNPNMRNVVVGHKELVSAEKYPISDGCAYVTIYTEEPCICFEDSFGRLYKDSIEYELRRVYDNETYIKQLMPYCGDDLYLSLHFCEKSRAYQDLSLETVRLYNRTALAEGIRPEYKQYLMSQVIDYYFDNYEGDDMTELLDTLVPEELTEGQLAKLCEALIVHGRYDDAYRIAGMVREERLNPKRVLRLCDQILDKAENSEELFVPENRFTSLVFYAFSKGKYNDRTLKFLNLHYNGSTSDMIMLWEDAKNNGIDVYELEERILCQMLFSGHYSGRTAYVFMHYYNNGAKERIVEAYLAYNAYNYFIKEAVVDETVFEIIEARLEAEKDVILVCRMALLKYYSECEKLDECRLDLSKKLVEELSRKGYVFSFYRKFAESFSLPYRVADKTVIEYHTNPGHRVVIHYAMEDSTDFIAMDMKNVYEGIFVKTFILFYGEKLQYYITEENGTEETATESCCIEGSMVSQKYPEGRYEMLNEMLACRQLHDMKSLDKHLHLYGINDVVVGQLFKPLN